MGTGVGEAMLIGAAVGATAGGAGAAIQGGDPLKGALTGGAMGAVGGGLSAGISGAAGGTAGGTAGGVEGGTAAATTSVPTASAISATPTSASIFSGATPSIQGATNLGAGISGAGTAGGYGLTAPAAGTTFGSISAPTAGTTFGSIAPGSASAGIPSGLSVAQGSALPAGYGASSAPAATNIFGQTLGQPGVLSNTALGMTAGTAGLAGAMQAERDKYGIPDDQGSYTGPLTKLRYDPSSFRTSNPTYAPASVYRPTYAAEGGIMRLAQGGMPGPVERMSQNMMGGQGNMYPLSQQEHTNFATPTQMPASAEIIRSDYDAKTDPYTGVTMAGGGIAELAKKIKMMKDPSARQSAQLQGLSPDEYVSIYGEGAAAQQQAPQQQQPQQQQSSNNDGAMQLQFMRMMGAPFAEGGISSLGSYSDGGRMLKGPGDGMSDNIPATIGGKQPARLADGEFVVPADVVSHLGNGSTDAGAKQLYSMMDRVRKARTGTKKQGKQIKPQKFMAA